MDTVRALFERWDVDPGAVPLPAGRPGGYRCYDCPHPEEPFDVLDGDPSWFRSSCSLPMPSSSYSARSTASTLFEVEEALRGPVYGLLWVNPWCEREPFHLTSSGSSLTDRVESVVRAALRERRAELETELGASYPTLPLGGPCGYVRLRPYQSDWSDARSFSVLYRFVASWRSPDGAFGDESLFVLPDALLDAARSRRAREDELGLDLDEDAEENLLFYELDAVLEVEPFEDGDDEQVLAALGVLVPEMGLTRAVAAARALRLLERP